MKLLVLPKAIKTAPPEGSSQVKGARALRAPWACFRADRTLSQIWGGIGEATSRVRRRHAVRGE